MSGRLLIAWPGIERYQRAVWSWLLLTGLAPHCDFCLQVGARDWMLTPTKAITYDFRDTWLPDGREFTHLYWDDERPNLLWRGHAQGFTPSEVGDFRQAREEIAAWQEARGTAMKYGVYGVPLLWSGEPRGFEIWTDGPRWNRSRLQVLPGTDWTMLVAYPPTETVPDDWITPENSGQHFDRVYSHVGVARGMAPNREPIPFLWPRWSMNTGLYGEVYAEAAVQAKCEHLGIWLNPHEIGMTRIYLRELNKMLPSLKRFCGTGE